MSVYEAPIASTLCPVCSQPLAWRADSECPICETLMHEACAEQVGGCIRAECAEDGHLADDLDSSSESTDSPIGPAGRPGKTAVRRSQNALLAVISLVLGVLIALASRTLEPVYYALVIAVCPMGIDRLLDRAFSR